MGIFKLVPVKSCSRCKEVKDQTDFGKKGDGLQSQCRTCVSQTAYESRCRVNVRKAARNRV